MAKRFPLAPAHPERNCWGCDLFCAVKDMRCGNGSERTQHPMELFGPDWLTFEPPQEAYAHDLDPLGAVDRDAGRRAA